MNEHDKREETPRSDSADELKNSIPPSTRDTDTSAQGKNTEEYVQAQDDEAADDTHDSSIAPDEAASHLPPPTPFTAPASNEVDADYGDTGAEPPETEHAQEEAMADTPLDSTTDGDDSPAGTTSDSQPEEPQRCQRMVLQAGSDEQSLKALALCRDKVKQLHLKMRPLAARYEGEKHVTIYFRADDKVDFRKLVRELSRLLHARIELRQVGPREQGKLCGLLGKCGYPLCCQTFLGPLAQSTIKMAKTQELALNPMKISGVCGRLLCCLNYEQEMYAEAKSRMPKVNRMVETEFGPGKVIAVNVLKDTVTVQLESAIRELRPDQVQLPGNHE